MVRCDSAECNRELEEDWQFCPYCGSDNRPPEQRSQLVGCLHNFYIGGSYCTRCGYLNVQPVVGSRPTKDFHDSYGIETPDQWDEEGIDACLERAERFNQCILDGHDIDWQYECVMRLFGWVKWSEKWNRTGPASLMASPFRTRATTFSTHVSIPFRSA